MYVYETNQGNVLKLHLMIRDRNAFAMIDQHEFGDPDSHSTPPLFCLESVPDF